MIWPDYSGLTVAARVSSFRRVAEIDRHPILENAYETPSDFLPSLFQFRGWVPLYWTSPEGSPQFLGAER
jgi:hypothetical protein